MNSQVLILGAAMALLMGSASAYADDPTGVLLRERGQLERSPGPLPEFSDSGPCVLGMHAVAFPTSQGYRCVRDR